MIGISSELGFWIVEAYRRMSSQLHVSGTIGKSPIASVAVISETSPIDAKICFRFFDAPNKQSFECRIALFDAKFFFDPCGNPPGLGETPGDSWRSFLQIVRPEGTVLLLGERFIKSA